MDRKLLKSLILEEMERMLNEQDDNEMSEKTRLSRDSVDDQIDSFILKFESQSVVDKDENDDTLEALEEIQTVETIIDNLQKKILSNNDN